MIHCDTQLPGFFAVIPANVLWHENIEANAKLLYASINSLTLREGYCHASNKYLAELFKVDESTVKRWLESLQSADLIWIKTEKKGMGWDRKIYTIKEMFAKGRNQDFATKTSVPCKNSPTVTFERRLENEPYEGSKISPYKDIVISKDNNTCGGGGIHKILDPLELSQEEKIKLTSAFPNPEDLSHGIAFAQHPKTQIKTSLMQTIWWAAKNKPEIPKEPKKVIEDNKNYAMSLQGTVKFPKNINFDILSKGVEIVYTGSQKQPDVFDYKDMKFKENLGMTLKTMQLSF